MVCDWVEVSVNMPPECIHDEAMTLGAGFYRVQESLLCSSKQWKVLADSQRSLSHLISCRCIVSQLLCLTAINPLPLGSVHVITSSLSLLMAVGTGASFPESSSIR